MSSLPKWIQKIKNRADKATPGPWEATNKGVFRGSVWVSENSTPENAQFAAHAREDVPKLIELVEEMAMRLERAALVLDDMGDMIWIGYTPAKQHWDTVETEIRPIEAVLWKYQGEDEDG